MILMILIPMALTVGMAQPRCSIMDLKGTYAVSYSGWVGAAVPGAPPPVYATIFGVVSIEYDGTISGGVTMTVAGVGATDYVVPGTVTPNDDCTGKLNLTPYPMGNPKAAGAETDRFVFDGATKTILLTIVSNANGIASAALGSWKQISPQPNAATW
jgi:hypothetical protein